MLGFAAELLSLEVLPGEWYKGVNGLPVQDGRNLRADMLISCWSGEVAVSSFRLSLKLSEVRISKTEDRN